MSTDTAEPSREIFWGMPAWAQALWYVLAALSVLVFAYGVARPIARYRAGDRAVLPPLRELPGRLREANRITFTHATIKARDPAVGWATGHLLRFLTLFAGTVIWRSTRFHRPVFGWRFFDGDF